MQSPHISSLTKNQPPRPKTRGRSVLLENAHPGPCAASEQLLLPVQVTAQGPVIWCKIQPGSNAFRNSSKHVARGRPGEQRCCGEGAARLTLHPVWVLHAWRRSPGQEPRGTPCSFLDSRFMSKASLHLGEAALISLDCASQGLGWSHQFWKGRCPGHALQWKKEEPLTWKPLA